MGEQQIWSWHLGLVAQQGLPNGLALQGIHPALLQSLKQLLQRWPRIQKENYTVCGKHLALHSAPERDALSLPLKGEL